VHVTVRMVRPLDIFAARASRFSIIVAESSSGKVQIVEQNEETRNGAERRNHFVRSFPLWCVCSIFKREASRHRASHCTRCPDIEPCQYTTNWCFLDIIDTDFDSRALFHAFYSRFVVTLFINIFIAHRNS